MTELIELGKQHILIDGGLASELRDLGCEFHNDPLWSARVLLQDPERIKEAHTNFLCKGAQLLITCTYQASIPGLCAHGNCSPQEAEWHMKQAVSLACSAVEETTGVKKLPHKLPLIAASIGPYGTFLHDTSEYTGSYLDSMPVSELCDWYRSQLSVLADTPADLIAFETIPGLKEAEAIVKVLGEFPAVSAYISFSCRDGEKLSHGETFREAITYLKDCSRVLGVGINCTPPQFVTPLLKSIQDVAHDKLLLVYPNSGEVWDGGSWVGSKDDKPLTEYVAEWSHLGARWIGGCCRVYPKDIGEMSAVIASLSKHT